MKTIDYYMGLPYKLEIVPDVEEGGYVARYPELPGCISVGRICSEIPRTAWMHKCRQHSGGDCKPRFRCKKRMVHCRTGRRGCDK